MMLNISKSLLFATVMTGLSYIVGFLAGWVTEPNWLEIFSVFTSYSCTYLCVVQSRINYIFGALATGSLVFLFYQANLLGSMAQNMWLFPVMLYGWFRWRSDADTRPVTSIFDDNWKWIAGYIGVTAVTYFVAMSSLKAFGGSSTPVDSAIFAFSILAQYLLDNKKIETWYVWVVVNVMAIGLYFHTELYLVAFQFVFFLINTVIGWYMWNQSRKTNLYD